jgi:hypothetical protein
MACYHMRRQIMTATVQQLLDSFDALPDPEKRQAAIEILRRYSGATDSDLTETALVGVADELFHALDEEEARHAPG